MEKGYVYVVENFPDALEALKAYLGDPILYWVADKARLVMGAGLPQNWKDWGAVFGPRGEIRWWRENGTYRALLLTEKGLPGWEPLPGEWERESTKVNLQALGEPRVRPQFKEYPYGSDKGYLEVQVYYWNGIPVFVSPRRIERS